MRSHRSGPLLVLLQPLKMKQSIGGPRCMFSNCLQAPRLDPAISVEWEWLLREYQRTIGSVRVYC